MENNNSFKCSCLSKTIYELTSSSSTYHQSDKHIKLDEFYITIVFFILFIIHMFKQS